jgi:hypothetical protein
MMKWGGETKSRNIDTSPFGGEVGRRPGEGAFK